MDGIFVVKEPVKFRNEIQELMNTECRNNKRTYKASRWIEKNIRIKKRVLFNKDNINLKEVQIDDDNHYENIILSWQVKSSLIVCEAIIRSALMRQESRGAHYRSDFPKLDDERWKLNIYCRKEVNGASAATAEEMILFKQGIKEIKGPLAEFLKSHTKADTPSYIRIIINNNDIWLILDS